MTSLPASAEAAGLPAAWLRDNCPCALCRDPVSGLRLAPGDGAVFDNTGILHARTGFASSGRRHLQGCYADLDGIESAVAVAGRGDQPERTRRNRK
ncbi:MAG TPA: TauD/TfdA family dioxygenase [Streptosporangiaceae bacterium]|nr:TauD/TfdA family dioxygenase [Streptosporangiaceae bacterium]